MVNPFEVIRKVAKTVGVVFVTGAFVAIVIGVVFSVGKFIGEKGWGEFFFHVLVAVLVFGGFGLILWLIALLGESWKKWEAQYAEKKARKAFDTGKPLLDPRPIYAWGGRDSYTPGRTMYGEFKPRSYYEQDEEKYKEKK